MELVSRFQNYSQFVRTGNGNRAPRKMGSQKISSGDPFNLKIWPEDANPRCALHVNKSNPVSLRIRRI